MAREWYSLHSSLELGIDWNYTSSATSLSIAPIVYRWDRYDTDNYGARFSEWLSPDNLGAGSWSGLSFGSGSGTRQIDSFSTRTYKRTHSNQTITLGLSWDSSTGTWDGGWVGVGSGSHSWTITVSPLASYSVSYNANGGSGAPAGQTKWYGENLTLQSGTPTRTGYTFKGWATSSTGSVAYASGATYTGNAALTLYAVWQINTWTVSYNANGGSGAPGNQTKTYGQTLTLSSAVPTRTGYTFKGWATSSTGSVVYGKGGSYTSNSGATLYAVWQINTWTVSYNANGGSGAPGNQTKTYGQTLTLSSTKPTRSLYNFKGWSTSSGGSVVYNPGASYTTNAALTLYAVWELAYISPSVSVTSCYRSDENGSSNEEGTYAYVAFTASADNTVSSKLATPVTNNIKQSRVEFKEKDASTWNVYQTKTHSSTTVNDSYTIPGFDTDKQYDVRVTVWDTYGESIGAANTKTATSYISMIFLTMDFLAGGHGIAFGKPSSSEGFNCDMKASFTAPVQYPVSLEHGLANTDVMLSAKRTDTGKSIDFGVGSGGTNRGIYDRSGSKWMIYSDANNRITISDTLYLSRTTDAAGTADNRPALIVGDVAGNHLELDPNEIMAKSSGTATNDLYLNNDGGYVYINGKNIPLMESDGKYWGFLTPDKGNSGWIRTTTSGIIPNVSGGSGALGTSSWPFNSVCSKAVYINGNSIADFVTEQNVSNGCYYVKWNSGNCLLYAKATLSSACTTSWGGVYESSAIQISWPFTLQAAPYEIGMVSGNGNASMTEVGTTGDGTATKSKKYFQIRPTTSGSQTLTLIVFAFGKWK